jgi:hypothetical protein
MSEVDGATLIARSLKQQGIDHRGAPGVSSSILEGLAALAWLHQRDRESDGRAAEGLPQRQTLARRTASRRAKFLRTRSACFLCSSDVRL